MGSFDRIASHSLLPLALGLVVAGCVAAPYDETRAGQGALADTPKPTTQHCGDGDGDDHTSQVGFPGYGGYAYPGAYGGYGPYYGGYGPGYYGAGYGPGYGGFYGGGYYGRGYGGYPGYGGYYGAGYGGYPYSPAPRWVGYGGYGPVYGGGLYGGYPGYPSLQPPPARADQNCNDGSGGGSN